MKIRIIITALLFWAIPVVSQTSFPYKIELQPVSVAGMPGLHSYAFAQWNDKILLVGGRLDGMHARQPFRSFPASSNNTELIVIDIEQGAYWSAAVSSLPANLAEQMQATNMCFYQHEDTLYIIGGYAFSATANDHITFPYLSTIQVSEVINAVISGTPIASSFKQLSDSAFAITGGQLGKIGDEFYLVGGHRFDGRYNPMGHATYVQQYSNQIRKFKINNNGAQLGISDYVAITDPVHLHRRDYNLMPQVFPNGTFGYTISSGVFQTTVDLPYLYPVDITATGHTPITGFNQYLSNYHSAKAALYDAQANTMHSLFFGGISQYYYENDSLIKDDDVPFVKTISLVSRSANGTLTEYLLPEEMPGLKGASAEFIPNMDIQMLFDEVIDLNAIGTDTFVIGHILGGISSNRQHAFATNNTEETNADTTIYAVRLIRDNAVGLRELPGQHNFEFTARPNPVEQRLELNFNSNNATKAYYFITDIQGKMVQQGPIDITGQGPMQCSIQLTNSVPSGVLMISLVFDDKYYAVQKLVKQ